MDRELGKINIENVPEQAGLVVAFWSIVISLLVVVMHFAGVVTSMIVGG